jgi:hypothetical protein
MPIVHARLWAPLLVFVALSTAGCDDSNRKTLLVNGGPPLVFPTRLSDPIGLGGVIVQPALIQAQRVSASVCPGTPPFLAPFNVVLRGDGRPDVFLSDVQMQFVDPFGVRAGAMVIGSPELTTRFGSTIIPAIGTREFPFSFAFGCSRVSTGTLTVAVLTGDSQGRRERTVGHIDIR